MRKQNSQRRAVVSLLAVGSAFLLLWTTPQLTAQSNRPKAGSARAPVRPIAAPDQTGKSQPMFAGWQDPKAVIVFSGQQRGYLEPCGCSPEFQKGGLARRFGFVNTLRQKDWPIILVDLGGLLDAHSQPIEGKLLVGPEQSQVKLETALQALHMMQYSVLNLGVEDIEIQQGFVGLMGLLVNVDNPPLPRAINANLGVSQDWRDAELIYPYLVRDVEGTKIAFVGVVGEKFKDVVDQEFEGWQPPEEILMPIVRKATQESSLQVLMLYGALEEAKSLAQKFPDFDVIIYASDAEEPNDRPEWANDNKTMLVTIGSKGKYTGTIGVFDQAPKLRFQLTPLDDRFPEDPQIRQLLDVTYIQKLADLDLVEKTPKKPWDIRNPDLAYVGSKKCADCHATVYEFWKSTRHAHALDTLVEGYVDKKHNKAIAAGKQHNPECVSCHTTGFFHLTGYDGTGATKHLGGNGCENCHGPGSEHVALMSNPDIGGSEFRRAKQMMHLGPQDDRRNVCVRCHDAENSPKFDLINYWDQIDHGGEAAEDKANWPTIRQKLKSQKDRP